MSITTHSRRFQRGIFLYSFVAIAFASALFARTSAADELDEIQAQRERSQMEYVRQVTLSKDDSPARRKELYKKTVAPALKRYQDFMAKAGTPYVPRKVRPDELDLSKAAKIPLHQLDAEARGGTSGTGDAPGARQVQISPESNSKGSRPEYALDGSNIPKEIDFAAKSEGPKPASLPSPSAKMAASQPKLKSGKNARSFDPSKLPTGAIPDPIR